MKMLSDENSLQHYGIPGMKWGHRRSVAGAAKAVNNLKNSYDDAALRESARADMATARAKRASSPIGIRPKSIRKLDASNAKAASESHAETSKNMSNLSKGVSKAQKLISGMDKRQSIATLESAAGYSKGKKIFASLMYGETSRLIVATGAYANKVTLGGRKDIGDE